MRSWAESGCTRRLFDQARTRLRTGGAAVVEIGERQAAAVGRKARRGRGDRRRRPPRPGGTRSGDRRDVAVKPDPVAEVVEAALAGLLVVFPTDTVYGLATRPDDPEATARLFVAKGRVRDLTLPVLVPSIDAARTVAELDARAEALAEALWPGALTIVLPRSRRERAMGPGRRRLERRGSRACASARSRRAGRGRPAGGHERESVRRIPRHHVRRPELDVRRSRRRLPLRGPPARRCVVHRGRSGARRCSPAAARRPRAPMRSRGFCRPGRRC